MKILEIEVILEPDTCCMVETWEIDGPLEATGLDVSEIVQRSRKIRKSCLVCSGGHSKKIRDSWNIPEKKNLTVSPVMWGFP